MKGNREDWAIPLTVIGVISLVVVVVFLLIKLGVLMFS